MRSKSPRSTDETVVARSDDLPTLANACALARAVATTLRSWPFAFPTAVSNDATAETTPSTFERSSTPRSNDWAEAFRVPE